MRVAGIDCGTNSVRLLVADVEDGSLRDVHREMRIVRLGQDVDRTGRFAPEALERVRAALTDYAATIREAGVERVRFVATSATRDVANRGEFTALVHGILGVQPEVVTGRQEAALSYAGAAGVRPGGGPLLVADVGGGSTELVRGGDGELRAYSMDVGAVRMTERHLADDPPAPEQVRAVETDVRSALQAARAAVPLDAGVPLVGVAGTVTTVVAMALGLDSYRPEVLHGAEIAAADVRAVTARLLAMDRDERAAVPVIHPGRVDVITGGAIVLRTLMDEIGAASLTASEHDILDGIVLTLR
jgi:exopolyphosphatase/guanosine-5'-triphosphate,3'-diphosphate pyrophosphatase